MMKNGVFSDASLKKTKTKLKYGKLGYNAAGTIAAMFCSSGAYAQCVTPPNGTCTIVNNANVAEDVEIEIPFDSANVVSITNNGNVTGSVWIDADEDDELGTTVRSSLTIVNNGTITVPAASIFNDTGFETQGQHARFTFSNTGTITQSPATGLLYGYDLVGIENEATGNSITFINNSGTISTTAYGGTAMSVSSAPEESGPGVPPTAPIIQVNNSGTISATGGALLHVDPVFNANGILTGSATSVEVMASLALGAVGVGGESTVTINNATGGLITAGGVLRLGSVFTTIGGQVIAPLAPPQGNIVLTNAPPALGTVAIAVYGDAVTIVNDGTISGGAGSALPAGINFTIPEIEAGYFADDEILTFPNRYLAGAIHSFADGRDTIINSATGSIIGSIDLGGGDDRIENLGAITGAVFLRDGDDSYVRGLAATQTGTVDGGAGTDSAFLDITGGGVVDAELYSSFVNFENFGLTGNGAVSFAGPLPFQTLLLSGRLEVLPGTVLQTQGPVAITGADGVDEVVNRGTIAGHIDLGAGNDLLNNFGLIDGDVSLGAGDDRYEAHIGSAVSGTVSGGAGQNTLSIHSGGTATAPETLDLALYAQFQYLRFDEGVGTIEDDIAFEQIDVNAGSLTGLVGSIITANGIFVAQGASFGSAGIVNAPVTVVGVLSPGASPGTMQITGNVALQSGSTTLFELTPTTGDHLLINGSLAIASNTTLNITGTRPLTPGVSYNLITASGGISGAFTTINRASTVLGFLRQSANSLDLLGTLQAKAGASSQVSTTVNYLNNLLIGGAASTAIVNSVVSLIGPDGFVQNGAAATLHPEAYASSVQIGIENGLTIASVVRAKQTSARTAGAFVYGQAFGNWRRFAADANTGTAKANVQTTGLLAGVGVGSQGFTLSAFAGYSEGRQPIATLNARNEADGLFVGANIEIDAGPIEFGGSVIRDFHKAETRRALFNGTNLLGEYDLRGWTADAYARLKLKVGENWTVGPEVGFTHITVKRGDAEEDGSPFALEVDAKKEKASFVTAGLTVANEPSEGVGLWLSGGVRQRTSGSRPTAAARFAGAVADFTLPGVQREKTTATLGAGITANLADGLSIFSRAGHEFGDGGSSQISAGLRFRF